MLQPKEEEGDVDSRSSSPRSCADVGTSSPNGTVAGAHRLRETRVLLDTEKGGRVDPVFLCTSIKMQRVTYFDTTFDTITGQTLFSRYHKGQSHHYLARYSKCDYYADGKPVNRYFYNGYAAMNCIFGKVPHSNLEASFIAFQCT
jgi:hypothetical protein